MKGSRGFRGLQNAEARGLALVPIPRCFNASRKVAARNRALAGRLRCFHNNDLIRRIRACRDRASSVYFVVATLQAKLRAVS